MTATVLVPIDIAQPEAGEKALELARGIANPQTSKFILMSVIEPVPTYVATQLPEGIHEKALSDAAATLGDIAARQGLPDTTETVVREGQPSNEILEAAKETGTDLIVIASHDPGVAQFFLGSVAARVVRHAHCSVLVARNLDG